MGGRGEEGAEGGDEGGARGGGRTRARRAARAAARGAKALRRGAKAVRATVTGIEVSRRAVAVVNWVRARRRARADEEFGGAEGVEGGGRGDGNGATPGAYEDESVPS